MHLRPNLEGHPPSRGNVCARASPQERIRGRLGCDTQPRVNGRTRGLIRTPPALPSPSPPARARTAQAPKENSPEVVVARRPGGTARRPRPGFRRRGWLLRLRLRHGRGGHGGVLGDGSQRRLPRRRRPRRRERPPASLFRGRSGGGSVLGRRRRRRRRRPARAPHEGEQLHLLICVRLRVPSFRSLHLQLQVFCFTAEWTA